MSMQLFKTKDPYPDYQEGTAVTEQEIEAIYSIIRPMIWIADGPEQNYDFQSYIISADVKGYEFELAIGSLEQSLIFTGLPLEGEGDPTSMTVMRNAFYVNLAPEERARYMEFLKSPLDRMTSVEYAYILLHGMERHLLAGDYRKAAENIMWMRASFGETKFQCATANMLMLTAMIRNRPEIVSRLLDTYRIDVYNHFSPDLYVMSMFALDVPLTAERLMVLYKSYGYEVFQSIHLRNLRHFPEVYIDILRETFREKFGADEILLSDHISQKEYLVLPRVAVPVFTSKAVVEPEVTVPQMTRAAFLDELTALVEEANERTFQARHEMYEKLKLRPEIREMMTFHPKQETTQEGSEE